MKAFILKHKMPIIYSLAVIVTITAGYLAYVQFKIVSAYERIVTLQEANNIIKEPNMPIYDPEENEDDNIVIVNREEDYSYLGADDTMPD